MNARDELADVLWDLAIRHLGVATSSSKDMANELLAAGYVKQRQVQTVADLDALPYESVVVDSYQTPYICERHRLDGTRNEWRMSGHSYLLDSDDVLICGPITVAYVPEPQP